MMSRRHTRRSAPHPAQHQMGASAADTHDACPTEGSARNPYNTTDAAASTLAKNKTVTTAAPKNQSGTTEKVDAPVADSIVPGTLYQGRGMRAAFIKVFPFKQLSDIDEYVRGHTAQLPMMIDQLPVTLGTLSPKARASLKFVGVDSKSTCNVRVRLCDLEVIKGFVPHHIEKSPTAKKSAEYKRWQSYAPPQSAGEGPVDASIYTFIGQFPMALSAEAISDIFYIATGIRPLLVDHLPKGAKVFLRSLEEATLATRWNQTIQVTEFGTLFAASPDSTADECKFARDQLLTTRNEVDAKFKRLAGRHDPYGTMLPHSKEKLAKLALAEKKAVSVVRLGANARNGTYPMKIELPKSLAPSDN